MRTCVTMRLNKVYIQVVYVIQFDSYQLDRAYFFS